jgi:MbtH protein
MSESSYGIIVNDAREFAVWPSGRKVPPGWRFAGPTGTQAEMQEVSGRQFIETAPAPFITSGSRPLLSQWAD